MLEVNCIKFSLGIQNSLGMIMCKFHDWGNGSICPRISWTPLVHILTHVNGIQHQKFCIWSIMNLLANVYELLGLKQGIWCQISTYPCTMNTALKLWNQIIYASTNPCAWNAWPKAQNPSDTSTNPCIWYTAPKVWVMVIYASTKFLNPFAWNAGPKAWNLMSDIFTYPCTSNTALKVWNIFCLFFFKKQKTHPMRIDS